MHKLTNKYSILIIFVAFSQILNGQNYCDFIQKVQNYQDSVRLKSKGDFDILDTTTFNLNTYLNFYDKLSVQPEIKIEVFFLDNFLDGNPYLVAIKKNQKLESIIDSLYYRSKMLNLATDPIETKRSELFNKFLNDPNSKARNKLTPEDSEYGAFQFLFFAEMGEQFALKWHSNYNRKYIICSSHMLEQYIQQIGNSELFTVDKNSLEKLKGSSLNPIIGSSEKFYKITWIENRTHSGIFRCTYRIERKFPFKIVKTKENKLVGIETNFLY